jgi:hypothetical protein
MEELPESNTERPVGKRSHRDRVIAEDIPQAVGTDFPTLGVPGKVWIDVTQLGVPAFKKAVRCEGPRQARRTISGENVDVGDLREPFGLTKREARNGDVSTLRCDAPRRETLRDWRG